MRPALHFTARTGWINDPHGITYRDGAYHVFYQYVPGQTVWGPNCHWGHASGPDLVTLTEHGVAIAPGEGDDGIWTGSLVTDEDSRAVVFYTSTSVPDFGIGRVRRATPDNDDWTTWTKGPVVAEAPLELDIIAYRDPFVRREGDKWRMFLGAGLRDGTATALSYTSSDLVAWTYEGVALQRSTAESDPVWMGALWECPQIFELDGRAVMVSSVWDDDVLHYAGYAIGSYANGEFAADTWGRLTYGDSYYAPSLFADADGRPSLLFWMRGIGGGEDGWASAHSVPHLLSIEGDRLCATPHPDLLRHRGDAVSSRSVDGVAADVVWGEVEAGSLAIKDGGGEVVANLRRDQDELTVTIGESETSMPVTGDVRILIDGPILEASSNGSIFGGRIEATREGWVAESTFGRVYLFPLT